jgi:hypothetical protein
MYKVPVFDVFELTNVPISIKYYEFKGEKNFVWALKQLGSVGLAESQYLLK